MEIMLFSFVSFSLAFNRFNSFWMSYCRISLTIVHTSTVVESYSSSSVENFLRVNMLYKECLKISWNFQRTSMATTLFKICSTSVEIRVKIRKINRIQSKMISPLSQTNINNNFKMVSSIMYLMLLSKIWYR